MQQMHYFWGPQIFFILSIVVTFIPLPSIQHFILPIDQCLLSDICNHTWFPECGKDNLSSEYRLFTDMCDMYEYNCDNYREFERVNLSDCYQAHTGCPVVKCPSKPQCRNHNFHRMGAHYVTVPVPARRRFTIPKHWLNGKRRYTRRRTKKTTKTTAKRRRRLRTFRRRTTKRMPAIARVAKITASRTRKDCNSCDRAQPTSYNLQSKASLRSFTTSTQTKCLRFQSRASLRSLSTNKQSAVILQPSSNRLQSTIAVTSEPPDLMTLTRLLRKDVIWKNGKRFYRVVKQVEIVQNESSGYLE